MSTLSVSLFMDQGDKRKLDIDLTTTAGKRANAATSPICLSSPLPRCFRINQGAAEERTASPVQWP